MKQVNKWIEEVRSFDFSSADKDEMGIWPTPIKALLVIALVSMISVFGYQFMIKKTINIIYSVESKEVEKLSTLQINAASTSNLSEYKKQMVEVQTMLNRLVSRLPTDIEVPGLLDDINQSAIESGLEIDQIELLEEVNMQYFVEMPINIVVKGGYQDALSFISAVSSLDRIVVVKDVVMDKHSDNKIKAKILAKTYRYQEVVNVEEDK